MTESTDGPARIYLECSETASTKMRTGIQRVVRNIILHHQEAAQAVGVEAHPARFACENFYNFDWCPTIDSIEAAKENKWNQRFVSVFGGRQGSLWATRCNILAARAKKWITCRSVRRMIRANWLHRFATPLQPRPGDLMVLIDATWTLPIWPAVQRWRQQGGKVAFVMYDLLQITHSQFVMPRHVVRFSNWFDQVVKNSDLLLAISDTVRDQLRELAARGEMNSPSGLPRIESFRLGSDLDMHNHHAPIRAHVRKALDEKSGPRPYLVVGTVEPRKNHNTVLDAFDRLWTNGHNVRLVIVGRRGWNSDELEQRILSHPRFTKELFWLPDLTDSELNHCYEKARALVFASWAEGFGLPIVEGLQHRLPVIASDLPVHREVAGNFAAFFDPSRSEELVAWIERLERQGSLPSLAPVEDFRAVTWRDGVTHLLQQCRTYLQDKAIDLECHKIANQRKAS